MCGVLSHRGPDSSGVWIDEGSGVGLAHTRLAIIDLSDAGHQPMESANGRYVISFNGEIYNYKDLRSELAGQPISFRGSSDTEVLVEGISAWGLETTLRTARGMFALAVWDRGQRVLSLARDRLGEKPIYYGWAGHSFLFGSELKALHCHPAFSPSIDEDAIALYLRYGYIPGPYSAFRGVRKLVPGTMIKISADHAGSLPDPQTFWSLREVIEHREEFSGSAGEVSGHLEEVLLDSVKAQMVADVPLGAFLSGGVDSSTVVALMQAESSRAVKTFSVGFDESGFDEAVYAKEVARHLGTDHTELYVSPRQALDVVPTLAEMYDEPFGDSSQIPTHLVSALARDTVTVALSGDGGDELFGGYLRYGRLSRTWGRVVGVPKSIRTATAGAVMTIPASWWARGRQAASWVLPQRISNGLPSPRAAETLAEVLRSDQPHGAYHLLVSHWRRPGELVIGGEEPTVPITSAENFMFDEGDVTSWAMFVDALQYLPDDILVKVDRASMAESLEVRVPLLDPRVVAFAWSIPSDMRHKDGRSKWPLREVLYKYVPEKLVDRPKMGFGVPIHEWLRGPLREWAEDLLSPKSLSTDELLDPAPVVKAWAEHLSGARDHAYPLWNVLQLVAWRRRWHL